MDITGNLIEGLGTTVIGMGIVFLTLIAIAFIISLLKYIGQEPEKPSAAPAPVAEAVKTEEIQNALEIEQPKQDELALVAAITAAVAASMGTSADQLRVVSIRKSDTQGWKNVTKREQHRHIY